MVVIQDGWQHDPGEVQATDIAVPKLHSFYAYVYMCIREGCGSDLH